MSKSELRTDSNEFRSHTGTKAKVATYLLYSCNVRPVIVSTIPIPPDANKCLSINNFDINVKVMWFTLPMRTSEWNLVTLVIPVTHGGKNRHHDTVLTDTINAVDARGRSAIRNEFFGYFIYCHSSGQLRFHGTRR